MIEISIQEDFLPMGTRIYVTNKIGSTRNFLQPDGTWISVELESQLISSDEIKPTILVPAELLHEVYEALTRHFHGADDARMLRKDYDAERARVDKLTDAVIDIAREGFHLDPS